MTSSSEPKEVGPRSCSVTPTKSVSFTGRGSHARKSSRSKSLTNNTSRGHSMRDLYKQPQRRDHSSYLTPSKSIRTAWTSSRLDDEYDEISDKLSTSLCLSDLSTWRSADLKGTHLKNKSLRRSLGYDNSSGRVTHRDEKILEALHAKNEREVELERSRSEAQLAWEEERMQLNHQKDLLENRRRQLLAHRIADAEEQQTLLKERQHRDEEVVRQRMLTKCQLKDASWRHSSDQQQLRRDLALTEKRRRSLNRKLSQERLLSEFERQRENELTKHQHQRENQRMRASMMKDHKYFSDREKKRKENEEEVQQHERRLKGLERMSKKFNESLRNSISEKAAKSLRNQVAVANSRDYNMHMNAKERQRKFYKSKRNQQKMEEEIGDWHRSLKTRRQFLDSKAKLTASQMVEIKALNAREERRDREDRQQKTYRNHKIISCYKKRLSKIVEIRKMLLSTKYQDEVGSASQRYCYGQGSVFSRLFSKNERGTEEEVW
ncbi:hypothetical protein EB796_019059 [Bugula neritina]|uniref:Uncharacterized protein n=1 Tax=Bugula neritina TaxID=10212 RepID=A0A7J7J8S5_BUGNE|nr:hypothetical protein EB796_019059 [Bugula neritina]